MVENNLPLPVKTGYADKEPIIMSMRRNLYKRLIEKYSKKFEFLEKNFRLKKFIFRFINVVSKWVRCGRQNILKLYTAKPYYRVALCWSTSATQKIQKGDAAEKRKGKRTISFQKFCLKTYIGKKNYPVEDQQGSVLEKMIGKNGENFWRYKI